MKASEYRINSKQSAEAFERRLKDFCAARGIYVDSFGLGDAYTILTSPTFEPRCFGAYLDLLLQDIALQQDINTICEMTNIENANRNADGFTDDRMERYIASSNAAHRIRAMWDKIMGLVILLEHPESYPGFVDGKSKLSVFKKINEQCIKIYKQESEEIASYLTGNLNRIVDNINLISNNYRTSEAHSVGRLSKWAFARQVDEDDPFETMINACNEIRSHMNRLISSICFKAAYSRSSGIGPRHINEPEE